MILKHICFIVLFSILSPYGADYKSYVRDYYPDGQLKSEGWIKGDSKTNYWTFYHTNGNIASSGHFYKNMKTGYWHFYRYNGTLEREGHYSRNHREKWWIFYDLAGQDSEKTEFGDNKKNGYSLTYKDDRLVKVRKFKNDQIQGEWTDRAHFKRDNPHMRLAISSFTF